MRIRFWPLATLVLLGGCAGTQPATWLWSEENAGKPGVGMKILVEGQSTAGTFYILDPQKPHDFTAARQAAPFKNLTVAGNAMSFDVTLIKGAGQATFHVVLELDGELAGGVGTAVKGRWQVDEAPFSPWDVLLVRDR